MILPCLGYNIKVSQDKNFRSVIEALQANHGALIIINHARLKQISPAIWMSR